MLKPTASAELLGNTDHWGGFAPHGTGTFVAYSSALPVEGEEDGALIERFTAKLTVTSGYISAGRSGLQLMISLNGMVMDRDNFADYQWSRQLGGIGTLNAQDVSAANAWLLGGVLRGEISGIALDHALRQLVFGEMLTSGHLDQMAEMINNATLPRLALDREGVC